MDILRAAAGSKDNGSTTIVGSSSIRSLDSGIGGGVGLQLLYHVLLVIWQLSFEGSLVGQELESYETHTPPHDPKKSNYVPCMTFIVLY